MNQYRSAGIDYSEVATNFLHQESGSAVFGRWLGWGVKSSALSDRWKFSARSIVAPSV